MDLQEEKLLHIKEPVCMDEELMNGEEHPIQVKEEDCLLEPGENSGPSVVEAVFVKQESPNEKLEEKISDLSGTATQSIFYMEYNAKDEIDLEPEVLLQPKQGKASVELTVKKKRYMSEDGKRNDEKKTSIAWQFFTDVNNSRAKCNFCGKVISYKGGGPYNLIRHTKSLHPTVFAVKTNEEKPSTSSTSLNLPPTPASAPEMSVAPPTPILTPSVTQQQPHILKINELHKPLTAENIENLNRILVKLFAKNYLPLSLVESPEFIEFVQELNPNYQMPSWKTLSVHLENHYKKTKEDIKGQLAESKYVALAIDVWSSDPKDNYVGVTAHFLNKETELKAYMLECARYSERHTVENLAEQLKNICENWEISNKVVAVCTDNANVEAAIRINNWKHVSCFAHNLNMAVQNSIAEIKYTHNKTKEIVELFKRSSVCERLRSMQERLGEPILKVKQDGTRWDSTYDMFERILTVKESLLSTIAADYPDVNTLNSQHIDVLTTATEILAFFKDVTVAERKITISEIIYISNALKKKCTAFLSRHDMPTTVACMVRRLYDELDSRFSSLEFDEIFFESTLLDPRYKRHGFHNESAFERACFSLRLSASRVETAATDIPSMNSAADSPPAKAHSIWLEFDKEVKAILKNTTPTSGAQLEIENYLSEPPLLRKQSHLKWWHSKRNVYPRLYDVACRRLCIAATSVPFDRIFSKAGQIISERRNLLSGEEVDKLLFLNNNL